MSTFTEKLPQSVVQKWRVWASDPAFGVGLDFLRHSKAPTIPRNASPADKLDAAVAWQAYHEALSDVEGTLTALPADGGSLDEPSLRG